MDQISVIDHRANKARRAARPSIKKLATRLIDEPDLASSDVRIFDLEYAIVAQYGGLHIGEVRDGLHDELLEQATPTQLQALRKTGSEIKNLINRVPS